MCGTGDLLVALEREAGRGLIGVDFCHPMLTRARTKLARNRLKSLLVESSLHVARKFSGGVDFVIFYLVASGSENTIAAR